MRWETCTLFLLALLILTLIVQWNEKDKLFEFLYATADVILVFVVMSLIGRT